jgi:MFS family permease
MLKRILKITSEEQRTFILHLFYSIIDGFILGLFALNEFILIKSLKGTDYQIGFLFQFTVFVLLFSIIINEVFKRVSRKTRMIRYVGLITRLPLLIFVYFPANALSISNPLLFQLAFLFIFLIYFMANPLLYPAINHLLKNSYSHSNFGRLYGYSALANKIMMLVSTFLFGILLDKNYFSFTYVYPFVAAFGILSIYILTKINDSEPAEIEIKKSFFDSIKVSMKNSSQILKQNKPYRDFEIAFGLYGWAWLSTVAVITIFFEKELNLNYSSIAFYKNSYNLIAIMVLPFFGKLLGKIDPRKFAIYTFSAMFFHLLFMALTQFIPHFFIFWELKIYYSLIASYISYGLFAAMMALLWYIGSAYFCRNDEVSSYQAIHLTLTGVRGMLAPLIGVFFYEIMGFTGVFGLALLSLALAVYVMQQSMKKHGLGNN